MKNYLNNLISEKSNISMDHKIEVKGDSGTNYMSVRVVVDHILIAPKSEQDAIKNMLVKIDFNNGSLIHFFFYLAQAIAK